jgi:hypothetical protein
MITTATITLLISSLVFLVLTLLVHKERRRGRRFFAVKFRNWLDGRVSTGSQLLFRGWEHFNKYIVQLSWYYSIHSVLKTILKMLVTFYTYFENIFENNRKRTKQLRAEKRELNEFNHLQQMTDHRKETALTASQQKKLKDKNLKG